MRISVGAFIPAAPFQAIASRASRRSPAGSGPTHRQTLPLGGVCVNRTSMLQSSLLNSVYQPGEISSSLANLAPSPYVWSSVVDAYLFNMSLGPKLSTPINFGALVAISRNDTEDIISAGRSILHTIGALRLDGVDAALKNYKQKSSKLAEVLSKTAVDELAGQDLKINSDVDYRDVKCDYYDNDDLKVELRRGSQIATVVGPKQGNLIVRTYRRRILPPMSLRGGNAGAKIDNWCAGQYSLARIQWVRDDAHYPLSSYENNEIKTDDESIRKATTQANLSYLLAVNYSQLTD